MNEILIAIALTSNLTRVEHLLDVAAHSETITPDEYDTIRRAAMSRIEHINNK